MDALRRAAGEPEVCSVTNLQPLRVREIRAAAQPPSTNSATPNRYALVERHPCRVVRFAPASPTGPGSGLHSGPNPP